MTSIHVLWDYRHAFISGLAVTFELLISASVIGTTLGICIEWLCQSLEGATRRVVDTVAFGLSTVPALVLLFWLYYPAQSLLGTSLSPFITAVIALTVLNTFAVYRIASDAMREFPKQYVATALVCGLNRTHITRHIQGPLLLRSALPRWIDQQVVILQTSVFASLIAVEEIFRVAQRINSVIYRPVVIYTSMAIIFFATAGSAMYVAQHLKKRFHRDLSER